MLLQFPGDMLGGAVLGVGQFGMGVQILVESLLASLDTFVTSQDLVDAVHTSVLCPERGTEGAPGIYTHPLPWHLWIRTVVPAGAI